MVNALVLSDCRFLSSSISLNGMHKYFLHGYVHQGKVAPDVNDANDIKVAHA